jgi:phage I-like protein
MVQYMKTYQSQVALAACIVDLDGAVPDEIRLAPSGVFRARDGRPAGLPGWRLDAATAERVIERMRSAVGDYVIDYEHQTLHAESNGRPAPAAGWWKGGNVEWRPDGLFATGIEWTEKAKAAIAAKEYRYISPVLSYNKRTGEVLGVLMAALTNYPAIDGLSDLAAMAAARFKINMEDETVDKAKLIALLGLASDATDEQIDAAMTALKIKAESVAGKDAEIASLKSGAGRPDPAKFVPVETFEALKGAVAALKAGQTAGEVAAMVDKGIVDGKLLPVQKDWATELGNMNIAALKSYLEKTPAIAALAGSQSGGKNGQDNDGVEALSGDAKKIADMFGNSAEDIKKYGTVN